MKLLIVEDEKMTREGLVKSLDWLNIGISNVFSAENGEAGLFLAKRILPDIVLTDIRMPRMDGITMAGRIREMLPDCRIIFLSAYSEIDYYKAAIDLKAVRYLDKPIEAERLREVIVKAVAECAQLTRFKSTRELQHVQEKQKLADAFCQGVDGAELEKEFKRLNLQQEHKGGELYITAIIVSLRPDYEDETHEEYLNLAAKLSETVAHPNLYTILHKSRVVLFLLTPKLTGYHLDMACKRLQDTLDDQIYYIVIGRAAHGVRNAHKTYTSARAALQKAYCYPWRQIVPYREGIEETAGIAAYAEEKGGILGALSENREPEALTACEMLFHKIKTKKELSYHKARELYFEIISEIYRKADSLHLQIKENENGEAISWLVRIENFNLNELHAFLCRQISLFYAVTEEAKNEKKQILAIRDYISRHYADDALSISDISAFLHMSASHVCTMFKKETGDTINNYLTEYRLKKAQQYLSETLFSVAEISAKVGYKDNSYFGRIFRKRFGMTPNEYRYQ